MVNLLERLINMNSWLIAITKLVKLRDAKALTDTFVDTLSENLRVEKPLVLELTEDGRELLYSNKDKQFRWSVVDFDVPFSHVLQESKYKILSMSDLVYWQGNKVFKKLVSQLNSDDSCLIYPLPRMKQSGPSLLIIWGETSNLNEAYRKPEFTLYLETFCAQWELLKEIKAIGLENDGLSETLTIERKLSQQEKKLLELSSTLIGNSSVMLEVKQKMVVAAESPLSVMIHGDTGTGKEVVARAIHQISGYKNGQFIAINCSAIPENLLESELFGYEKGAFSGADSYHAGLIEQADGGTLFLDEIGDMPMNLQSKLLRVLETKCFRPLGGKSELVSRFRLISATHINLKDKVKSKEFRPDLYYRLMQCPLSIPSLSDCRDDIEALSEFFVDKYNENYNREVGYLTKQSLDYLKKLDFSGNVRELKSMIELSCSQVKDGQQIGLSYISDNSDALSLFDSHDSDSNYEGGLNSILECFELKVINDRLKQYSGNKTQAAKSLGIPLRTLTYKCQKLEICG